MAFSFVPCKFLLQFLRSTYEKTEFIFPGLNSKIVVDWAAHLGGVMAGFAASFLCFAPKIKTKFWAVFWFLIGVAMTVSFFTVLVLYMLNKVNPIGDLDDVCGYYQKYFDGYECHCQLSQGGGRN